MAGEKRSRAWWRSTRWLIGLVLVAQGFGSAATETLWDTSFGVAGLVRAAGMPVWTDLVIGAAGVALLVWATLRKDQRA